MQIKLHNYTLSVNNTNTKFSAKYSILIFQIDPAAKLAESNNNFCYLLQVKLFNNRNNNNNNNK